jgi:hypothetical protein
MRCAHCGEFAEAFFEVKFIKMKDRKLKGCISLPICRRCGWRLFPFKEKREERIRCSQCGVSSGFIYEVKIHHAKSGKVSCSVSTIVCKECFEKIKPLDEREEKR